MDNAVRHTFSGLSHQAPDFKRVALDLRSGRLGRNEERNEALSFINLDAQPDGALVEELRTLESVNKAVIVEL